MADTSQDPRAPGQELDGHEQADRAAPSDDGTRPLPYVKVRSWPRADPAPELAVDQVADADAP